MKGRDLSKLQKHGRVVLINAAANMVPGDVIFTADSKWIAKNRHTRETWEGEEIILAVSRFHQAAGLKTKTPLTYLYRAYFNGMSLDPRELSVGGNSGQAAINLALLKGSTLVYLLGFDLNPGPHTNWHDEYKDHQRAPNAYYYAGWAKEIDKHAGLIRKKMRVVNLNPSSEIKGFEFGRYEDLGI